jgi:microcystin-dependent protein
LGIGTSNPTAKIHVKGTSGLPATSGVEQTGTMRLGLTGHNTVLDFGAEGPTTGKQWIQSTDAGNLATSYPLLLNPRGGNVGVGTTSPARTLDIRQETAIPATTYTALGGDGLTIGQDRDNCLSIQTYLDGHWSDRTTWGPTVNTLAIQPDVGNVGIGTTTPAAKLDVNGSVKATSFTGNGTIPVGGIIMWSGATAPAGWSLCNGQNGTPDLRDRFVVGSGASYAAGATGGSGSVTLNANQMPPHAHGFADSSVNYDITSTPGGAYQFGFIYGTSVTQKVTDSAGGGQPVDIRPPYYALAFIMRTL